MFTKNKDLWRVNTQGGLEFKLKTERAKATAKPETFWNHQIMLVIIIIICGVVDFCCFLQMANKFMPDSNLIRWGSILGLMFAFDVVPIFFGLNLRKFLQGYNIKVIVLITMAAVFLVAFFLNVYLRIKLQNIIMPNFTDASSLIGEIGNEATASERALPYAIFASLLPLITSLGSFGIAFFMTNFLKLEMNKLEEEKLKIADGINQIEATLSGYEEDLYNRLINEDKERFDASRQMIIARRDSYREDVRIKLKIHLGNPVATNELSRPLKIVA